MMPIEKLLYKWCCDNRAKDRSHLIWIFGAVVVIVGGLLAVFWWEFIPPPFHTIALLGSLVVGGVLCGEANRRTPATPAQLLKANSKVPDDFLELLADDESIPVWVKSKVFRRISTKGSIGFRELADLDADIEEAFLITQSKEGVGYKKLSAFAATPKPSEGAPV